MSEEYVKPRRNTTIWVVSVVVAAALLAFTAVGLWVWQNIAPDMEETVSETYEEPVERLKMDMVQGEVSVRAGDDDTTTVERTFAWSGDHKPRSAEKLTDGTLAIDQED